MAFQTSIPLDPALALEGMIADMFFNQAASLAIQDAAGVAPGIAVAFGTVPADQCKLMTVTTDVSANFAGFVMFEPFRTPSVPNFGQYTVVSVMRRGHIWLRTVDAMAVTDVININYTTGRIQVSATGATAAPNGALKCLVPGGAGALVKIEVNLP